MKQQGLVVRGPMLVSLRWLIIVVRVSGLWGKQGEESTIAEHT